MTDINSISRYEVEEGLQLWFNTRIEMYKNGPINTVAGAKITQLEDMLDEVLDASNMGMLPWDIIKREGG